MNDDCKIDINFLPVVRELPPFRIHRKLRVGPELRPDADAVSYSFAKDEDPDDRETYWVKAKPAQGYEEYTAQPNENNNLTRWALSLAIMVSVRPNHPPPRARPHRPVAASGTGPSAPSIIMRASIGHAHHIGYDWLRPLVDAASRRTAPVRIPIAITLAQTTGGSPGSPPPGEPA
jgi:hypothetical protein